MIFITYSIYYFWCISVERMWAPWRIEYIKQPKSDKCILCVIPKESESKDRDNLLLYRGEKAYILMNRYPYNNGHLMIVPYRHVKSIVDLDDDEILEMHNIMKIAIEALDRAMHPHGFNIGSNIGAAAGAGIEDHFHIHIVPRWIGDTNFMPVLANTKVMVEYLDESYDKIKREILKIIYERKTT